MIHLALLGLLGVAVIVWVIKIRAWELSVTVEMPAQAAPPSEPAPE